VVFPPEAPLSQNEQSDQEEADGYAEKYNLDADSRLMLLALVRSAVVRCMMMGCFRTVGLTRLCRWMLASATRMSVADVSCGRLAVVGRANGLDTGRGDGIRQLWLGHLLSLAKIVFAIQICFQTKQHT